METANAGAWEFEGVGPTLIRSLLMHCDARKMASARDWGPGPKAAQVRDIPGGTLVLAQNGKWGLGYLVGKDFYPVLWGTRVEVEAAAHEVVLFGPPGGVGVALDAWDFEDDSLFRVSTAPMRGTFRIMIRPGGQGTLVFVRDDNHVVYLGAGELDELKATADERLARRRDEILRVRIAGQILELNGFGRRGVIAQALVVYGGVRLMLVQVGPDRFELYYVAPAGAPQLVGEYRGADLESGDLGEIHLSGPAQRGAGPTPPTATTTAASSMSSPAIEAPPAATATPAQSSTPSPATTAAAPPSTDHAGGTRPPRTSPHQSRATHRAAAKTPSPPPPPPLPSPEDYEQLMNGLGRPQVPDHGNGVSELANFFVAFRVLVARGDLEDMLLSSPGWKKFIEANTTVRFGHRERTFLRALARFLSITGLGEMVGRRFRVCFGDLRRRGDSEVWATVRARLPPMTDPKPANATPPPAAPEAAAASSTTSPATATATAAPSSTPLPATAAPTATAAPSSTSSPATAAPSSTPPTATATPATSSMPATATTTPSSTPSTANATATPSSTPPAVAPSSPPPTVTAAAAPPSMSSPAIEAPVTATAVPALSSTPPTVTASASPSSTSSPATATPLSAPPIETVTAAATPSTTPPAATPTVTAVAAPPSMHSPAIEAAILLSRLIATPLTSHASAPSVGPDVPGAGNPAVDHERTGAATMYCGGLATDVREVDGDVDLDDSTAVRPRLTFLRDEDRLKPVFDRSWTSDATSQFAGNIRGSPKKEPPKR
ncbi:MAG: hypothetical protein JNL82_17440 [Myxococcales bacterium]|nr:hypothetical protein [Myxococcales bacterium]